MRALDSVDAIDLYKAKSRDQVQQIRALASARGRIAKQMVIQKQRARLFVFQGWNCHSLTSLQRIAVADRWCQFDPLVKLRVRCFDPLCNDLRCLAPNLQTTGIHGGQLPWQTL